MLRLFTHSCTISYCLGLSLYFLLFIEETQRQATQQHGFYPQNQLPAGMYPMQMPQQGLLPQHGFQQGFQPQQGFAPANQHGFIHNQQQFAYQSGFHQQNNMQQNSNPQSVFMPGSVSTAAQVQQPANFGMQYGDMTNLQQGNTNSWINSQSQTSNMQNQSGPPMSAANQTLNPQFAAFQMNSASNVNSTINPLSANDQQTDDFGDFSDFKSQSNSATAPHDDFQAFSGFSSATSNQSSTLPASSLPQTQNMSSNQNSDGFEDFSGFHSSLPTPTANPVQSQSINSVTAPEEDFGDFGSFSEPPLGNASVTAPASANNDDDFGDFGSFEDVSNSAPEPAKTSVPAPVSQLDGKRINIVVKKNLAANSAGHGVSLGKPRSSSGASLGSVTFISSSATGSSSPSSRSRSGTGPTCPGLAAPGRIAKLFTFMQLSMFSHTYRYSVNITCF